MRTQSKRFEFVPDELSLITYQIQDAERLYQKAKDNYDILEDSSKDLLAELMNKVSKDTDLSAVKAEALARSSKEWKDFKKGLYEAKRFFGTLSCDYKHSLRVLDCLITGVSYNKVLLSKNVLDGGK